MPPTIIEGIRSITLAYPFAVGSAWTKSVSSVRTRFALCTSTTGVSPVTVTVSVRLPTFMSAFTGVVLPDVSSRPSRFTVAKPVSVNVSV